MNINVMAVSGAAKNKKGFLRPHLDRMLSLQWPMNGSMTASQREESVNKKPASAMGMYTVLPESGGGE